MYCNSACSPWTFVGSSTTQLAQSSTHLSLPSASLSLSLFRPKISNSQTEARTGPEHEHAATSSSVAPSTLVHAATFASMPAVHVTLHAGLIRAMMLGRRPRVLHFFTFLEALFLESLFLEGALVQDGAVVGVCEGCANRGREWVGGWEEGRGRVRFTGYGEGEEGEK